MAASMKSPAFRLLRHVCSKFGGKRVGYGKDLHVAWLSTTTNHFSLVDQFRLAQDKKGTETNPRPAFRTSMTPTKHTMQQEGMFYTIHQEDVKKFLTKGFSEEFKKMTKTFNECCVMVRRPAVEVIHYLKNANYSLPVVRYVLYGPKGSGKTTSLAHVMHYCALDDWILVHCPWPTWWNNHFKEVSSSSYKPGRVDLPLESIELLKTFRQQNDHLIKKYDLKTSRKYVWSKREATEEGTSWDKIIEHGITRAKYASDCIGVLLREIKLQASQKGFKALVVVDGVNAFWAETTLKDEHKNIVPVENYSLVHNFKKIIKNDWSNGAVLVTVDENAHTYNQRPVPSYMPRFLLGKHGFEWMDPFVPVSVDNYSDKEIHSCLDYFIDRKWIQNPKGKLDEGKKEIIFISDYNPLALYQVTAAW